LRTARGVAPELRIAQPPADEDRLPRQVLRTAPVEAMDPVAHLVHTEETRRPEGSEVPHEHRDAIADLDPDGHLVRYHHARPEPTSLVRDVVMPWP